MFPVKVIRAHNAKIFPILYSHIFRRCKSTKKNELTSSARATTEIDTNLKPLGEKIKETTTTASYLGIILIGVGVVGTLFYTVFGELFSSKSPNNVYSKAAKRCINYPAVEDKLGYPITSYGEETRRGRRQHVSHAIYMDREGRRHLRMKFHLKGTVHSGTVNLDVVENDSGDYEYRYLFVQVDDMFKSVIVLEDNRNRLGAPFGTKSLDSPMDLQL